MLNLCSQPEEAQYLRTIFARRGAGSVCSRWHAKISIAALVAVPASAVRAPEPAPGRADTSVNKIVAGATVDSAGIPHSSPADRRSS